MLDVFIWLIAIELIGLLAFPLAFALLPWLPDRGYSLTKPLGLLLAFYPLWLLGSTQVIPNGLLTIALILVMLGAVALLIFWLRQNEIAAFLGQEWKSLVLTEVVFLSVFAIWVYIKAYDPAIDHTEQPMDFAFLTTSSTSLHFPPRDPWLAGESVSYYYFGYLMMGGLSTLTGIATSVSYNLALALVPAMAAVGAFGIGSGIVRLVGGSIRASAVMGLVAALLLVGISNMESLFEFMRASGVDSVRLWEWVDIKGLDGPSVSSAWYPTESGWWWWRATRVIDTVQGGTSLDYTITEFPFFSFLLGDLHPHVMSIPFVLLFSGVVLNLFVSPEELGLGWVRRNAGVVLFLGVALGGTGFISLWDLPTMATLFGAAVIVKAYRLRGTVAGTLAAASPVVATVVPLAVLLYLPFYATFGTSADGILPVDSTTGNPQYVTRYFHFVVVWGLFLLVALPFLLWELSALLRHRGRSPRAALLAISIPMLPLAAWALVEGVLVWDPSEMPGLVWGRFVHVLPLLVLLAAAIYVLLRRQRDSRDSRVPLTSPARGFALLLLALAFLLLLGPELFYVVDLFNNRMNTVFKLYYQAWVFLALASSFALYYLGVRFARSGPVLRIAGYGWITVMAVAMAAGLYYPAASTYTKASGLGGEATLDGLAYVERQSVDEYLAIQWLRENSSSRDRILEAVGRDYVAETSRVSASTGIPTVLGWPGHEEQWRGSRRPFEGREEAIQMAYQSTSIDRVEEILREYELTYVYVGPRERAEFGRPPLEGFEQILEPAFLSGDVRIYRYRG